VYFAKVLLDFYLLHFAQFNGKQLDVKKIVECAASVDQTLHVLGPNATVWHACLVLARFSGTPRWNQRWMAYRIQEAYLAQKKEEKK
jgi:hypothetical protein